jgi:hypothetical protein
MPGDFAGAAVTLSRHGILASDHLLRPAVSAAVLEKLHLVTHAIEVPVNHERLMANATRDAVLMPRRFPAVVRTGHKDQRRTREGIAESCPLGHRGSPSSGSAVFGSAK